MGWGVGHGQRPDPLAGGKGVAAPTPRSLLPLSAFGPSVLSPVKNLGHALGHGPLNLNWRAVVGVHGAVLF